MRITSHPQLTKILVAVLCIVVASATQELFAQNLILNPSFENYGTAPTGGGFRNTEVGNDTLQLPVDFQSSTITDWTAASSRGWIIYDADGNVTPDGNYWAMLDGLQGAGAAISQTGIALTSGVEYELSFDAVNELGNGTDREITFEFVDSGNVVQNTLTFTETLDNAVGSHFDSFTLAGPTDDYTLRMYNSTGVDGHVYVDNLRLAAIAVPEPASISIWGAIGIGLIGFFYYRRRKS